MTTRNRKYSAPFMQMSWEGIVITEIDNKDYGFKFNDPDTKEEITITGLGKIKADAYENAFGAFVVTGTICCFEGTFVELEKNKFEMMKLLDFVPHHKQFVAKACIREIKCPWKLIFESVQLETTEQIIKAVKEEVSRKEKNKKWE